jgi:hypothetical protein
MTTHFCRYGAIALMGCALLSPSKARAGIILITWGETVSHIGDVSAQNNQNLRTGKVGYKYSYWGVFWIDLWTHSGTYCVYEGERYKAITAAEAARLLGKIESELSTPFLYKVPLGWIILGLLILFGAIARVFEKKTGTDLDQLLNDSRYQDAFLRLQEHLAKQPAAVPATEGAGPQVNTSDDTEFRAAFEAGVHHLIARGILREEAERNFAVVVQALVQAQQQNAASIAVRDSAAH